MPGDHLYGGNTPGFNACILTLEVGTNLPASIDGERHRVVPDNRDAPGLPNLSGNSC